METPAEAMRHLQIEGFYNLRDVGGYATSDGRRTRWRALLRSDSPHRLTPGSWRALRDYGVRTIVDLRRSAEVGGAGYRVDQALGINHRHIPLFDDDQYQIVDQPASDLSELYQLLLDHCAGQFATVLRAISSQGAAPALIHCAVGKDRTGLTIALALGLAGVPAETIAADYALSATLLKPLHEEFFAYERAHGGDVARLARMLESRHDTMLGALAYLGARYGGAEGYLRRAGITATEAELLRMILVER